MGKLKHYIGELIKNMDKETYDEIQDFLMCQTYKKRLKISVTDYPIQLKKDYEKNRGGY